MFPYVYNVKTGNKICKPTHFGENVETCEIVGMVVVVGARDEATAHQLWESLPSVYRQCAVCYSDFWKPYAAVLPAKRHH
jgi:IS1 family transposase